LLCEAYCNSWQFEKLYKASRLLWKKATGDQRAIEWMQVTLRNEHIDDKDMSEAAAFADLCLTNNYGTITGNTIYKAKTIALDKKYSVLERKTKIRTLFVDALRKTLSKEYIDGFRAANSFSSTLDYGDLEKVFTDEEKNQLSSELKTIVDQKMKSLVEEVKQEMKTQPQPSDTPNPHSPSAQGARDR
jgi:hypothetical protein